MGTVMRGRPRVLLTVAGLLALLVVPAVGAGSAAAVAPTAVTLTANRTVVTTGQTATLTATANQVVNGGNLYLQVFDVTSGSRVCIDSYVTSTNCTVPWRAQPHTYLAYVAQPGLDNPPPGIQATSDPVTIEPAAFEVTLATPTPILQSGQTASLTATANQVVNGGNLYLQIFDVTSGSRVCIDSYVTSTNCTVPWRAQPHTFVAVVAQPGLDDPPPGIQAESEPLTVEPRTGIGSVYFAIHQWSSGADPSHTSYDITAAGQGLATGSGPCLVVACGWALTVTYTDAQSVQQVVSLGTGNVAAGQDSFTTDRAGTLDLDGATAPFLTLTLTAVGSPSPALAAGGPVAGALSAAIVDGIDIGSAFAQITAKYVSGQTGDPCSNLLFVPGTRVEPTSTSDEYNECELATGGGATRLTLQQLMALVRKYGPQIANVLAGTPTTSQTPTNPAPLDLDIHLDQPTIDRVADVIIGQSRGKIDNKPQAKIAAEACLKALARLDRALPSPPTPSCTSMPVFFPGGDNPATTANDYDGIWLGNNTLDDAPHYAHILLKYAVPGNRLPGSWKNSMQACKNRSVATPCDEYPFLSTQQAGGSSAALALVPRSQNSSEGGLLGAFYRRCGLTGVQDAVFLVIPLIGPSAPKTLYTCGS